MTPAITSNDWEKLRLLTPARLALGRVGNGMPTREVLAFSVAHAMARDAIYTQLDTETLSIRLSSVCRTLRVRSAAADRAEFLRRPDLGRMLLADDRATLKNHAAQHGPVDCCIVIGDGLSSLAIEQQAVPLLATLLPMLPDSRTLAPVVIATQARVALSDDVGESLRARLVVMLIGERPGLSSPDSLGVYLTYQPRRGNSDAQRNCVSNIRPSGLDFPAASCRIAWLIQESLRRGLTGVDLKDESDVTLLPRDERIEPPLPIADGSARSITTR